MIKKNVSQQNKLLLLLFGCLVFTNQVKADQLTQWNIYEIKLESGNNHPWWAFPVEARCIHQESKTTLIVDGFWDGKKNWTIRFTPIFPGTWTIQTKSNDKYLNGYLDTLVVKAPTEFQIKRNPNFRGHLKISKDQRYFEYADGTPFLLLADTNWSINTARCGLGTNKEGPFYLYLKDRKKKGFSAILMAFMRGFGDTSTEVAGQRNEGGYPFLDNNLEQLNTNFFTSLDERIREIWELGFVIAVHPTWFGKLNCFFSLEWAKRMSTYLMVRYGVYNLLWSLSGEYQYSLRDCGWSSNQINEIGGFVQAHNTYGHPMSIHPSGRIDWTYPHGEQSSLAYHKNSWLDHTWLQTGQSQDRMFNVVTRSIENYNRKPTKPVFLSESFYERESDPDHAYHTRWQAWNAFLNGALGGYGYGALGIWNFFEPNEPLGETGKNVKNTIPWQRALHLEGSTQIQILRKLLKDYRWWHLKPCRELIGFEGNRNILPSPDNIKPISGARIDSLLYIFYLPKNIQDKHISIFIPQSNTFKTKWFNPSNGNKVDTQYFFSKKRSWVILEPPDPKEDWVLILEKGEAK